MAGVLGSRKPPFRGHPLGDGVGRFEVWQLQAAISAMGRRGTTWIWADYRFQVEALMVKEVFLAESEKKKLGPLGLRLCTA